MKNEERRKAVQSGKPVPKTDDEEETEKSQQWKNAVILYTLAWPFSIASIVIYALFVRQD